MKITIALLFTAVIAFNTPAMAQEQDDTRQNVEMPAEMKQMFLKNMRGHMEALDLIIAALAESNLSNAADIAESSMGVGHGKKRQCDDGDHKKKSHQAQDKGKGKPFGQFMPPAMKVMGMGLHNAANEFADVARQGSVNDAYKALRLVSASCVSCHQSFKVQ